MVGVKKPGVKTSKSQEDLSPKKTTSAAARKSPTRSPKKRNKSPGRPPSPGRPRSPGRPTKQPTETKVKSPARPKSTSDLQKNKSPDRQSSFTVSKRSPIRRSPARAAKAIFEEKEKESSLGLRPRKPKLVVVDNTDEGSDSGSEFEKPEVQEKVKEKPKAAVRGRTRQDIELDQVELQKSLSVDISSDFSTSLRRVTRSSQNREVERIVHLKNFDTQISKTLGEFSDEDDTIKEHQKLFQQKLASDSKFPYEFGGTLGAIFLMLFSPVFIGAVFAVCNDHTCSFTKLPLDLEKYKRLSTYFDAKSFLGYAAFLVVLAVLSALPFGGRKVPGLPNKHGKLTYVTNGLFSTVLLTLVFITLEIKNIPIANYITEHIFQLYVSATILAVLLAFYAFVRSYYVPLSALNTHVVGKSRVYSFFMGREVHPRVFGLVDLKMFVLRLTLIGAFLVDFAYVYESLDLKFHSTTPNISQDEKPSPPLFDIKSINIRPTLLVYFFIHSVYILDGLIFEHTWITSAEVQQEGFGYVSAVGYSFYPFMTATAIRFIVNFDVNLAWWKLALTCLLFLAGYVLYRGSNNEKDAFRKNPYSPSLAHLETIPTSQGKKLLCSGFWGMVRHPNYLGDILMNLSFVPFVVCAPPVLLIYAIVAFLVHRTVRDNAHCREKYGPAWDRYCNRVRYALVPKVY